MPQLLHRASQAIALLIVAAAVHWPAATHAGASQELDLTDYRLTFDEEFDSLDVSPWGPGTRWIAHTPWAGDFGDAKFIDPVPGFPFKTENGILSIEARKGTDGRWRSGLLASVDRKFQGFAQKFGYFEIRAKLPAGAGLWPAFWLVGVDRSTHTSELDILEHHGHMPYRFSSSVHVWDRKDGSKNESETSITTVPAGSLSDGFNTYGALIEPDTIRIYFNRREVWRAACPPHYHQPMFVMLNLAMGSGWPIDKTPSPSFMLVDYVKVWSRDAAAASRP